MHSGPPRAFRLVVIAVVIPLAIQCANFGAAQEKEKEKEKPKPAAKPGAAAPSDPDIDAAFARIREGRSDDALRLLKEKAPKHPDWPPVQLIMARLLSAINQTVPARRSLELAVVEAPKNPEVFLTLGLLALGDGRNSDAALNFEHVLALVKDEKFAEEKARNYRRDALSGLAAVAESHEDWARAESLLRSLLELEPHNGQARQRLGAMLFRLGKPTEAFAELKEAVKDAPALEPPGVSMARLAAQKGDLKKAEEWFDYAKQVDPKSARIKLAHATWLFEQGRAGDAKPEIEQAVKLEPTSTETLRLQALIAWHLRELAAAQEILEPLHRDAPADAVVANLLALALVEQSDPAKRSRGLQLAEVNASQFPRSPEVAATLGWALYQSGQVDQADQKLRASVSGARTTPDIAYFLARVLVDKGLKGDAKKLLESATRTTGAFAHREEAAELLKTLGR
jgi:Tfp pilus assembly protein PilF